MSAVTPSDPWDLQEVSATIAILWSTAEAGQRPKKAANSLFCVRPPFCVAPLIYNIHFLNSDKEALSSL